MKKGSLLYLVVITLRVYHTMCADGVQVGGVGGVVRSVQVVGVTAPVEKLLRYLIIMTIPSGVSMLTSVRRLARMVTKSATRRLPSN